MSVWNIGTSVLLSLLVLSLIGYLTFDPETFRETLRYARPWMLVGAVAMALSRIGFGGWRLSSISRGRLDLASGTRGQLAWYFFPNITPTLIAIPILTGASVAVELLPSAAGPWGLRTLLGYFGALFVWGTGLTYFTDPCKSIQRRSRESGGPCTIRAGLIFMDFFTDR